ncbi:hypothetical protein [Bradyrhizobium sp. McL0616]|uniref:hypothetical protein n=1 Tax=Bradyrhizobium sp. McL0616 TaxID=3415674 RepID=UPI003CEDE7DE
MKVMSGGNLEIFGRDAMRGGLGAAAFSTLAVRAAAPVGVSSIAIAVRTGVTQAQQAPAAAATVTEPATGLTVQPDYARTVAQMAFVCRWPMAAS